MYTVFLMYTAFILGVRECLGTHQVWFIPFLFTFALWWCFRLLFFFKRLLKKKLTNKQGNVICRRYSTCSQVQWTSHLAKKKKLLQKITNKMDEKNGWDHFYIGSWALLLNSHLRNWSYLGSLLRGFGSILSDQLLVLLRVFYFLWLFFIRLILHFLTIHMHRFLWQLWSHKIKRLALDVNVHMSWL